MRKDAPHIKLLGKIFFPGQAPWQQRRKVSMLLWTVAAGVFMGGAVAAFILFGNSKH